MHFSFFFLLNHKYFPISISILLYYRIRHHFIGLFVTYSSIPISDFWTWHSFSLGFYLPQFISLWFLASFGPLSNITLQKSLPGELHLNNVLLHAMHSYCMLHCDTKHHLTSYVVHILSYSIYFYWLVSYLTPECKLQQGIGFACMLCLPILSPMLKTVYSTEKMTFKNQ